MKFIRISNYYFCVILFFSLECNANVVTKYYDPAQEELIGTIIMLTFPGPPNYENIKGGDIAEKCPYLILDHPINVVTQPTLPADSQLPYDDEKEVQFVQLAVGDRSLWRLMKDEMRVIVKGELFEAFTGHHHTRVLMSVKEAKKEVGLSKINFNQVKISCKPDDFCEVSEPSKKDITASKL